MTTTEYPAATSRPAGVHTSPTVEHAQELLHYLTEESYRFYSTPEGPIIRPAGAYPKSRTSDYAHDDACELQETLMESDDIRTLVSTATSLGFSLHLLDITDEGEAVFAKEIPGVLYDRAEQVNARL